jgi:hypothetical protein
MRWRYGRVPGRKVDYLKISEFSNIINFLLDNQYLSKGATTMPNSSK